MKWEAVDGCIEAQSRYHDDDVPFKWWIVEEEWEEGCYLYATKELMPRRKWFATVFNAMSYADNVDSEEKVG